jgi:hypothetical protein
MREAGSLESPGERGSERSEGSGSGRKEDRGRKGRKDKPREGVYVDHVKGKRKHKKSRKESK